MTAPSAAAAKPPAKGWSEHVLQFTGAVIAPGGTAHSIGNFLFNGNDVQIGDSGTYQADINSAATLASLRSDTITATGVYLSPDATISLDDLSPGTTLPFGTVLTLIDDDSISPISGVFENLPDGSFVTVGSNTYQADYEGGLLGNALTLTVVPEPAMIGLCAALLPLVGRRVRRRPR